MAYLQHDYFSSFSQSNHWFVALSLSSSFLKLKLRTDDGDGKEDRWEFAYLMSKNNVYCTRYPPRTCVSLHFDIYVWRHLWNNRELKQRRRWRERERHLKMWLPLYVLIFQLLKVIMLDKCVLTILDLNWNQRLGFKKTKLNICHHMLTSSTQLHNRSFHVIERTRTSSKCQKMKNACAKRANILFFIV